MEGIDPSGFKLKVIFKTDSSLTVIKILIENELDELDLEFGSKNVIASGSKVNGKISLLWENEEK